MRHEEHPLVGTVLAFLLYLGGDAPGQHMDAMAKAMILDKALNVSQWLWKGTR